MYKYLKHYNIPVSIICTKLDKVKKIVCGGDTRAQSVSNAFEYVDSNATLVAIHDGARPLATVEVIEETASTAVTTANTASTTASEALQTASTKASIDDNVASATTPKNISLPFPLLLFIY